MSVECKSEKLTTILHEKGWNVKEEFLEKISSNCKNVFSVLEVLLNTDIKCFGVSCLPNESKFKYNKIKTPIILQVMNCRNVSAPKINEESTVAPRLLKLTLTDGCNIIHALELNQIPSLSSKIAPGTKVKLLKVNSPGDFILLTASNIEVLGGRVEDLYEKWKLTKDVSKYAVRHTLSSENGGPPPWIPFGKKIMVERDENFVSLSDRNKKKENDEFAQQTSQTASTLLKENQLKVFGGGKQMLDSNVEKIINAGAFTIEEAEWALKRTRNEVQRAIQLLRKIQAGDSGSTESEAVLHPQSNRGRRGKGRMKQSADVKGPDWSDEETSNYGKSSKPAFLLDFLHTKLNDQKVESSSRYDSSNSSNMKQKKTNEQHWPTLDRSNNYSNDFENSSGTQVGKSFDTKEKSLKDNSSMRRQKVDDRRNNSRYQNRDSRNTGYNSSENFRFNEDSNSSYKTKNTKNSAKTSSYSGNSQNNVRNQHLCEENTGEAKDSTKNNSLAESTRNNYRNSENMQENSRGNFRENSRGIRINSRGNFQEKSRGNIQENSREKNQSSTGNFNSRVFSRGGGNNSNRGNYNRNEYSNLENQYDAKKPRPTSKYNNSDRYYDNYSAKEPHSTGKYNNYDRYYDNYNNFDRYRTNAGNYNFNELSNQFGNASISAYNEHQNYGADSSYGFYNESGSYEGPVPPRGKNFEPRSRYSHRRGLFYN